MDDIQIAYHEFNELIQNYRFDLRISCHKKLVKMILDFRQNNFHHIAGLQYVDDIDIPKNGKRQEIGKSSNNRRCFVRRRKSLDKKWKRNYKEIENLQNR